MKLLLRAIPAPASKIQEWVSPMKSLDTTWSNRGNRIIQCFTVNHWSGFLIYLILSVSNELAQGGVLRSFTQGCLYFVISGLHHEQKRITMMTIVYIPTAWSYKWHPCSRQFTLLTPFLRRTVKSTTETSGTGTRKAIPVSFLKTLRMGAHLNFSIRHREEAHERREQRLFMYMHVCSGGFRSLKGAGLVWGLKYMYACMYAYMYTCMYTL